MAVEPRGLTYEDYAAFPDDGIRREIVGGEVYELNAPTTRHQRLVLALARKLADHVDAHGLGEVFVSPLDVLLDEHDIVQPDIVFVAATHAGIVTDPNLKGIPDLLIEVVSDPRHDRIRKRDLYARAGVTEYWIVDPDADRIEIYRLRPDGYPKPEILEPGDELRSAVLPGFGLDLTELFAR
jgi:Uma2 family endonuclease